MPAVARDAPLAVIAAVEHPKATEQRLSWLGVNDRPSVRVTNTAS
jgi:hypothetical protein